MKIGWCDGQTGETGKLNLRSDAGSFLIRRSTLCPPTHSLHNVAPAYMSVLNQARRFENPASVFISSSFVLIQATYEVCTLWVNGKYVEALDTFNHLTQRLASPYSIVPEVRKEESRRSALLYDLENLEDDYPAWASILNLLASDE